MFIYVYITTYIYIDMHYVHLTYVYTLDNQDVLFHCWLVLVFSRFGWL